MYIAQTLPKGSVIKSKMLILCGISPHLFHQIFLFHIVFKNFSSKLVVMIQYCFHEIHGRYNLLLLLKTNNQMWLAGANCACCHTHYERSFTMSNQPKHPTISFRINDAERRQSEARILASGMMKKDASITAYAL